MSESTVNDSAQNHEGQDSAASFQENSQLSSGLTRVLSLLQGVKQMSNGHYMALCPGHKDTIPSLSITETDSKILLKCFAGCQLDDILIPMGLEPKDLLLGGATPRKTDVKKEVTTYNYTDAEGKLLSQVVRYQPKSFSQRRPDGKGGWIWNLHGVHPVLYHLPEVLKAVREGRTVFIAEGEKDCDNLRGLGLVATTNPGGAGKWKPEYSAILTGANVVVLPDKDEVGRKHGQQVADSLHGKAATVKILELPGDKVKDATDWRDTGGTSKELDALVTARPIYQAPATNKTSQGRRLIELALGQGISLFRDQYGEACARTVVSGHFENWRLNSKDFKNYLGSLLYEKGEATSSDTIKNAISGLSGEALFGKQRQVCPLHNRVAWLDNAIYYDLSDDAWRVVKITPEGWEIVEKPPILFRRYRHQSPQVEPAKDGNPWLLFEVVRVPPELQLLVLVWVTSCLIPDIPHPVPVIHGPEGSAKSWLCYVIRNNIDPSLQRQLALGTQPRELVQTLDHNWCALFDNVTYLSEWQVDSLCRAVTGDGFSKRELYSDDDDYLYTFRRCVGLNTINPAVDRPDFLDRAILIALETIPDSERRGEAELSEKFSQLKPQILGGLFDTLAKALRIRPQVKLAEKPRMADFAEWGYAISQALGHTGDDFMDAYNANIKNRHKEILAGSTIGTVLMSFMADKLTWEGTATELLGLLTDDAEKMKVNTTSKGFPKAANALSSQLTKLETNLAKNGILIEKQTNVGEAKQRGFRIAKQPLSNEETSSTSSLSTTEAEKRDDGETLRDDGERRPETIRDDARDDELASRDDRDDIPL